MYMNKSHSRIISMVALVATIFVMLFSVAYSSGHVNHHCNDSADCPICSMLAQCEGSLKSLGTGLIAAVFYAVVFSQIFTVSLDYKYQSVQTTLVSQKVRLDS